MTERNLSDYVLESKDELTSLADAIREKSGATGELSVADMKVAVEGISGGDNGVVAALIDRSVTEIEMPRGVTTIGASAFMRCNNLQKVVFNDVTSIASYAFSICNSLKKIDLPNGLKILDFAVFQNTKLEEISLPNTLQELAQFSLGGTALTNIVLPNSVTKIHASALTTSLTKIYCDWAEGEKPTVEANVPWGATNAEIFFRGDISTEGVTFSLNTEGTGYIVSGYDMTNYDGSEIDLVIGRKYNGLPVVGISGGAFDSTYDTVPAIKSISLPNTLTSIGVYAFSGQGITSITIPDSVTEIGNGAFENCRALTTATLGSGCAGTEAEMFIGCEELHDIYVPWGADDNANTYSPWGAVNATIHCSDGDI